VIANCFRIGEHRDQLMTLAEDSFQFLGSFEAELLVELMLRYWNHPLAADQEFRGGLLEAAAEILRASINGQQILDEVPPRSMNLVAAIWYAEFLAADNDSEQSADIMADRKRWLETVRHSLPSCFCDPDNLKGLP
jgi:hypothetical protein